MVENNLAKWEPIAKAAYLGYGSVAEPRTGIPLPRWETLSSEVKQAWIAASKNAIVASNLAIKEALKIQ